jgi:NAD(P)-dependent dehydrogenase (short-subunit alcohol dehydrogenase family)
MKRFEGKTALVTGGNSGIGLATALAFAREGARVVITGRDPSTLDQAKAQLGVDSLAIRNDASRIGDATALAETLGRQSLRLDAVFINAGVVRLAALEAVDERQWDESFNTNVKGPYFLLKTLTPLLNPGATIVLNGSINAHIGMPNSSVYSASKAALISLAKTLSSELLSRGVRVNVISPGPVETPIFRSLGVPVEQLPDIAASILAQIPLKRFGTPDEIASAVLYLSSAESAFIVGTELVIDGGMSQL